MDWEERIKHIRLLIDRLERLSADSIWSHRASGIRGSLLEYLDDFEEPSLNNALIKVDKILDQGYYILGQAAKLSLEKKRYLG